MVTLISFTCEWALASRTTKFNKRRTFGLTAAIAVVTAVAIIATSVMVTYWKKITSSGYLTYLSECSHSCGGGIQYFQRICDNTSSTPCDENKTEIQPCNTDPCPGPVNGSWSSWTSFSKCSDPCGGGAQYRTRDCNSPSPAYGGLWCNGKDIDIEWCNTIDCSNNGSWGEWSLFLECSKTCGGGIRFRIRECHNPSPGLGGKWCDGDNIDIQMCNVDRCPVNGSWSEWTAFTQCSVSCGGGFKSRQRKCDNPMPAYGGRLCEGNERENKMCSANVCPGECYSALNDSSGHWTYLSECSKSCGGGIRFLRRVCDNTSSMPCDEIDSEIQQCNTDPCPGECYSALNDSSGHWTYLSECSKSCGGGIRFLRRVCDNTSSMPCDEIDSEIQQCNTDPCPDSVNSTWGAWNTFSECSDSCGGGARYRTRECNNPSPAFGGLWCDGRDIDIEWCNTKGCPLNGSWGEWTSFSYCSYTCGGGMKYRVRECDNPSPAFDGTWCTGNDTDIAICNVEGCPANGSWSEWTSFIPCSVTCGGGLQSRTRRCDNPSPANGGKKCEGKDKESRLCNTDVCPVQGIWESWIAVTECSSYYGGGTQYRIRKCNNPSPAFGGSTCPGNKTSIIQCPVNGGWGNWGSYHSCSRNCGGGYQTRYRSCSNPYPAFGGTYCSGSSSESQSCNTGPCPVSGGWSGWSSIFSCSATCGGGIRYYIRRCTNPRPAYGGSWYSGSDNDYFRCNRQSCPGPTYELWVGTENMSANKKDWAIYYAKQALKTHGMTTSAAKEIRYKMQGRYDGNWNSIIGPCNYHYWITFKNNHHLYFSLGDVCIGIFRSPE